MFAGVCDVSAGTPATTTSELTPTINNKYGKDCPGTDEPSR